MYFLQLPSTNDFIAIGILSLVIGFCIYKFYRKKRKEKEELNYNSHTIISSSSFSAPTAEKESIIEDTVTVDPIIEFADSVELPTPVVKTILGISLTGTCLATTAEEAMEACTNGTEDDSDAEYLALEKWIELENDAENAKNLYDFAEEYHSSMEDRAAKKWDALALHYIDNFTSEEELLNALEFIPTGGEAEKKAIKKLYEMHKNK